MSFQQPGALARQVRPCSDPALAYVVSDPITSGWLQVRQFPPTVERVSAEHWIRFDFPGFYPNKTGCVLLFLTKQQTGPSMCLCVSEREREAGEAGRLNVPHTALQLNKV